MVPVLQWTSTMPRMPLTSTPTMAQLCFRSSRYPPQPWWLVPSSLPLLGVCWATGLESRSSQTRSTKTLWRHSQSMLGLRNCRRRESRRTSTLPTTWKLLCRSTLGQILRNRFSRTRSRMELWRMCRRLKKWSMKWTTHTMKELATSGLWQSLASFFWE